MVNISEIDISISVLPLGRAGVVGGVSDPQNCKIQNVPGYTKNFEHKIRTTFRRFSIKIGGGLTLSLVKIRKLPNTFNHARQLNTQNWKLSKM